MNLNIKATGIELTPAISSYVEKKISSVEKYIDKDKSPVILAEVGKSTKHHKVGKVFRAEVRISGLGRDVYVSSDAEDLYAAIDLVRDELVREVTREKVKQQKMLRRGGRMIKDLAKGFPWVPKRFRKGDSQENI